jgi:DNA polymerase-3 subunit delta
MGMADWQVRYNILPALRKYNARKVLQILSEIRLTDEKSKGVGGSKVSPGDLLKELIFFILH